MLYRRALLVQIIGPNTTRGSYVLQTYHVQVLRIAVTQICFRSLTSRFASSSSQRWQSRHGKDIYAKEARIQGLKSRAAFKLLEINEKYKIFSAGQTVVDLVRQCPHSLQWALIVQGFAPGSWSQVAADRTSPNGRVIGIDIIPAQPPKGVSTIQGNFLSEAVRDEVKNFLRDPKIGKPKPQLPLAANGPEQALTVGQLQEAAGNYFEANRLTDAERHRTNKSEHLLRNMKQTPDEGRVVDVVLSDMSEPWEQTSGLWKRSLSDPYYRMMNTSGMNFRDHAGSMDLCIAALRFGFDILRPGGHLVCKFYQGVEDRAFEARLKALFTKVHREQPKSSRNESKEAYFVALLRKRDAPENKVFGSLGGL